MPFTFLPQTSIWNALSSVGKTIETPKGIFYWSARANKEAEINGTIGVAQDDDGTISHLRVAEEFVGPLILQRAPKGKVFGYAPIEGVESLRKKWLAEILKKQPEVAGKITLPVVTNGITHSLALAGRLFLEAGQTLVTAEKSWENYEHIYTDVQEIKIAHFSLFQPDGSLDLDSLIGSCREVAQRQKKVVLLLNFPHNQTGFMPTQEDALRMGQRLHELAKSLPEIPFVILLDDAYEGYVYDSHAQNFSILSKLFAEGLPNFTLVKMDGISKVLLAYGYRIGFLTVCMNSLEGKAFSAPFSPEELAGISAEMSGKIGGFVRGEISQVSHHGQLLADALFDPETLPRVEQERAGVIAMLKERYDVMMHALDEGYTKYGREKLWADPCNGGFFCYVNLAPGINAKEIAERLLKEKKVGVVPSEKGLRVAFSAVKKEKIAAMVQRIFEVVYS